MNFLESLRICFTKYAVFNGRAHRLEFWWFQLFVIFLLFLASGIDTGYLGYDETSIGTPTRVAVALLTVFPMAAVTSRRFHDIGKSGWFQLPFLLGYLMYLPQHKLDAVPYSHALVIIFTAIMFYSIFAFAVWLKREGDQGSNHYGLSPKV